MLGSIAALLVIFIRTVMHQGVKTGDELSTISHLPVLSEVPLAPLKTRTDLLPYLKAKPTSPLSESIRNLRTSILMSNNSQMPKVIMSTSSVPGESKTTTSLALTRNLADLGKNVLLIEADIRRCTFGSYFDIPKDASNLLHAMEDPKHLKSLSSSVPELQSDVIFGTHTKSNAADVFSSDSFATLISRARELYDFVVIDTPPVLLVPDARIVGKHVDATIYSVKWSDTGKNEVVEGLKRLDSVGVHVTGLVLSQVNTKEMKAYGYGAYNHYSGAYYDV